MALLAVPELAKFAKLQRLLALERYEALGLLECLWHFTHRNAPQGDIGRFADDEIAAWIGWKGDPKKLIKALVESHWIDRCRNCRLLVHHWQEHCTDATKLTLKRKNLHFFEPSVPTVSRQCPDSVGTSGGRGRDKDITRTIPPLPPALDNDAFRAVWLLWKSQHKKYKPVGEQMQLSRIAKMVDPVAAVEYSLAQGFTGVYEQQQPARRPGGYDPNETNEQLRARLEAERRNAKGSNRLHHETRKQPHRVSKGDYGAAGGLVGAALLRAQD